jgi:hypothetical protein
MGAFTWTDIKVSVIDHEQGLKYCELAEKDMNSIWYWENYIKHSYEYALNEYKKFMFKEKKYFMEECNVPESHFTDEYIENEFKKKIEEFQKLKDYINKYRNNEISFIELVDKSSISKRLHCRVKRYNGDKYIEQYGEIFRLYEYDRFDVNLHTVEDLIDYLRSSKRQKHICDFAVEGCPYEGLTDALTKRIRDHYGKIGDNNFIVNFG